MINFKLVFIFVSILFSLVSFILGDFLNKKDCNNAIDAAVLAAQTNFELQIEKANSQSQKVIIKTIKQNEVIKKAVSSYDIMQRTRLLAQIENFEIGN
jgi:hypothetical protein